LRLEDKKLRIFDPVQNCYLLSHEEAEFARRQAEAMARQAEAMARQAEAMARSEAEARQRAEARIQELEEQLARIRTSTNGNGTQGA
jgi:sRNA-binding protein